MISFKEAMKPYINKDGFVAGTKCEGLGRTCDNHVMFTAEYYALLKLRNELTPDDIETSKKLIDSVIPDGILRRYPGDNDSIDQIDNWLGLINWCVTINYKKPLLRALMHGLAHLGFYNPTKSFNYSAFLWRFPQIFYGLLVGLGIPKILYLSLDACIALIIGFSCFRVPPDQDMDSRRLSWHLQRIASSSILCYTARRIWWSRLMKDFGPAGMNLVEGIYFNPEHPFSKYFINDYK